MQECGERALAALLAAMQRSGEGGAGAEAGGEAGEGALDDLLFFADKEGDGPAFGRWVGRAGRRHALPAVLCSLSCLVPSPARL